ncbi:MAG: NfeD family protein [Acutalibacteraceae bacterium]
MEHLLIMWIVLAIVFAVIEAVTVQIVTIWFAVGAVGAIIAYVLGANEIVQLTVFVAVSLLTLIIARPYLKKFTKTQVQPTNADMYIGKQALVTERIDNNNATGQAKIGGSLWTARSADGSVIEKDSLVSVMSIEGVKLIVKKEN